MKLNYILCLSGFLSLGLLSAQAQDYTGMKIQRYRHWAKGQISLVPLEIGQITPEGWLRQWGEDAAKGITGHLDEYQPVYGNDIDPETGKVLPMGARGELVFTCLDKEAFPLLRYRTRDISQLDDAPCACGRSFLIHA